MGYTDLDQLAINTIRVLAVSSPSGNGLALRACHWDQKDPSKQFNALQLSFITDILPPD
jgi:hypothetical protein